MCLVELDDITVRSLTDHGQLHRLIHLQVPIVFQLAYRIRMIPSSEDMYVNDGYDYIYSYEVQNRV